MPRVFEVMTDMVHPKTGVLILDEQKIQYVITSHKTIKQYAYILHASDKYMQEDEQRERQRLKVEYADIRNVTTLSEADYIDQNLRKRDGQPKPAHWHIVLRFDRAQDVDTIANWFGVAPNFVEIGKGQHAFIDKVEYLTHEHESQQSLGKYLYPDSEVRANFDFRAAINNRTALRLKYGKQADSMKPDMVMMMHVLQDGWSLAECENDDPITYARVRAKLPPLRADWLFKQAPVPFRMNIYVEGNGGAGKGTICQYIAEQLFPNVENPACWVGNDPKVAFDRYDGEPVLIWEDYRSEKLIDGFGREGTFAIFDTHPKPQAQNVKYGRTVLRNVVNIVNGVEPYIDFLDGLAGEYKDRSGNSHAAEDKNQAYRRFPEILCIHEEDYDVLYNHDFMHKNTFAYQQYDAYARVRGSMSKAAQRLEGKARAHVLIDMTKPVVDCYHMLETSHNDKISEVEDIPEEFRHYGEIVPKEEITAEYFLDLEEYSLNFLPRWKEVYEGSHVAVRFPSFEQWQRDGRPNYYNRDAGKWERCVFDNPVGDQPELPDMTDAEVQEIEQVSADDVARKEDGNAKTEKENNV